MQDQLIAPDAPVFVTDKGLQNLRDQLAAKRAAYADVCEQRRVAFELSGDGWHDNPEFNRMQQLEANLNHVIKLLTERLERARCVEVHDGGRPLARVGLGSVVTLQRWYEDDRDCKAETWEITGFEETDLASRRLAYNAPLAKAVLGLSAGDMAEGIVIGDSRCDLEVLSLHRSRAAAGL